VPITLLTGRVEFGIVIHFTRVVQSSSFNEHVLEVLVRSDFRNTNLACRCPIIGTIVPVKAQVPADPNTQPIIKAEQIPPGLTDAVAFIIPAEMWRQLVERQADARIVLRGDFVIDEKERAVDAEFARAQLPTGDRPKGSKFGIQGGTFESWFILLPPANQ
jgi:hypothetical protein